MSRREVADIELPDAQHAFEVFTSVRTGHVVRAVARFLSFEYAAHQRAKAGQEAPAATPVEVEVEAAVEATAKRLAPRFSNTPDARSGFAPTVASVRPA